VVSYLSPCDGPGVFLKRIEWIQLAHAMRMNERAIVITN
jgi:hypothetical protein